MMWGNARFVLLVPEDPLAIPLDIDLELRIDQLFRGRRRDGGPTFELLLFAAQPEALGGHDGRM